MYFHISAVICLTKPNFGDFLGFFLKKLPKFTEIHISLRSEKFFVLNLFQLIVNSLISNVNIFRLISAIFPDNVPILRFSFHFKCKNLFNSSNAAAGPDNNTLLFALNVLHMFSMYGCTTAVSNRTREIFNSLDMARKAKNVFYAISEAL